MVLDPSDVGHRIVVRHDVGTDHGRTVYTDVLGVLESWSTDDVLLVRRRDGSGVRVPWKAVVAGKPVPFQSRGRAPHTGSGLDRIAAAGLPALVVEPLGDWLLQAAAGFTGRANAAVPAGDPGVPLTEALRRVREFYAEHDLPARIQVVVDSDLEAELLQSGWVPGTSGKQPHEVSDVQVVPLPTLRARLEGRPRPTTGVELGVQPDAAWVRCYGRGDPSSPVVRHVLSGPAESGTEARITLARIVDATSPDGLAGIARGAVTGPWLGIAALEVAEQRRRQGLATDLVAALAHWGADHGALWAYLQVGELDVTAREWYERLGFRTDHRYRYLTAPD